jgi:hypothetical protein
MDSGDDADSVGAYPRFPGLSYAAGVRLVTGP